MDKFTGAALFFIVACLSTTGTSRADVNITCPLDQAHRTITDTLPDGWWTTPIVNRLSKTEVSNIAGQPALICIYGVSGSVQRRAPAGQTCVTTSNGFRCTGVADAARTFSTGRLDIPQSYTFDLDHGRVGGESVDIWFQAETRDLLYLTPRNGAQLGVGDRSNRGHGGCSTARHSSDRISLSDVPVGSYICARTNEGRVSQFRINRVSAGSPKTLSIGYTTWQ